MPHGQRDWSNIGADETVHGLADMAELAARLGSPVTFNREGNVLFVDTFDHGMVLYEAAGIGPGNETRVSAEWSRLGPYSLKFTVPASASKYQLVDFYFPYPVLSKFGVEFSCLVNNHITIIQPTVWLFTGTTRIDFQWYHYVIDKDLKVVVPTGFATIATDVPFHTTGGVWHTEKVVFDAVERAYLRWMVDNAEYDCTPYAPNTASATGMAHALLRLQFYGADTGIGIVYVDDLVITQNEP